MGGGETVNQHIAIGIGCSSRAIPEDIISLIERCAIEIVPDSIIATLDRRSSIAEVVAATLGLKLMLFPGSILAQISGVKNHSLLAYTKVGTSSVAEAAALASLGPKAQLSLSRQTGRFCTCAVAVIR
jgi:cobalt-precorrin 5A hydrolase